ncbi:MAG: DUF1565 domain-containing protein [Sedimentisphaerales bacterium]|nr:DUF1565 domain-containing protein [Sedimentisphaerales bacterium]
MNARKWIGIVLSILVLSSSTLATTYYVSPDGNDLDDGTSWASAFATIQKGLNSASYSDEIWVAQGTYKPSQKIDPNDPCSATFQLIDGVGLYGGFAGTETSRDMRDWANNETILSGDIGQTGDSNDNSYHVVTGAGGPNTIIDGFTITSGHAIGSYYGSRGGGGMYNYCASPKVANCIFKNNLSEGFAGGMMNESDSATVTDCNFTENDAPGEAGAIYCWCSSSTFTNCAIIGNEGGIGGAIVCDTSNAVFSKCVISDNNCGGPGGAVAVFWTDDNSPSKFINCLISRNKSQYAGGAFSTAGYNLELTLELTNCTITSNIAETGPGGAMFNSDSDAVIKNCIFWGNTADEGGEIYNSGQITFSYCDIEGGINGSKFFNEDFNSIDGGGNIASDPCFCFVKADANNFHLSLSSPCINKGEPNGSYEGQADIDGDNRVINGRVDIGADEVNSCLWVGRVFDLSYYNEPNLVVIQDMIDIWLSLDKLDSWCCTAQKVGNAVTTGLSATRIDNMDRAAVMRSWQRDYGDPNYNPSADFDLSGNVDDTDKSMVYRHWFQQVGGCPD